MPMPPLTFRLSKGTPLTPAEMDNNLRLLANFANSLEALFNVALNPDGTLKVGAVNNANQIADRTITNTNMNWLFNNYGVAASAVPDTYTLALNPTTGFAKGDGITTALVVYIKFTTGNAGPATLNINADGAQPIVKAAPSGPGLAPLISGDIPSGSIACLVWNGTSYQMIGLISAGGLVDLGTGVTGILGTASGGTGGPGRAFSVNLAGAPTALILGPTIIPWTAKLFDIGTKFDLATDRYTCDVTGYYYLEASVIPVITTGTATDTAVIGIYKNAVEVARGKNFFYDGTYPARVSTIQAGASGDIFDARLTLTVAQNVSGDVTQTFFCGHRILA